MKLPPPATELSAPATAAAPKSAMACSAVIPEAYPLPRAKQLAAAGHVRKARRCSRPRGRRPRRSPNAHEGKRDMIRRPGGELATRPLHFIWLADCSGSMGSDGKIQALNTAIREAVPHMRRVADENPNAHVLVRAVKFASGAQWHIAPETAMADFKW